MGPCRNCYPESILGLCCYFTRLLRHVAVRHVLKLHVASRGTHHSAPAS